MRRPGSRCREQSAGVSVVPTPTRSSHCQLLGHAELAAGGGRGIHRPARLRAMIRSTPQAGLVELAADPRGQPTAAAVHDRARVVER